MSKESLDIDDLSWLPPDFFGFAYVLAYTEAHRHQGIANRSYRIKPSSMRGPVARMVTIVPGVNPVFLEGVPTMPPGIAAFRMFGHVTLCDVVTGDAASWDLAALISRNPATNLPIIIGDTSNGLFQEGPTMSGIAPPVIGVSPYGATISLTGLAGRQMAATGAILYA